jgi:cyclophilin family peptidyl-prolyl cis-trans isomerase
MKRTTTIPTGRTPTWHLSLAIALSLGLCAPLDAVATRQSDSIPIVVLETSLGEVHMGLFPDRAPKSTAHFLRLVERGFYDEILFHRVVRDFVVQAGLMNMDGELVGDDIQPVENEADNRIRNSRGTVALARLDDPHSARGEFFINVRDNRDLDFSSYRRDGWGYAVFGEIIEGMDVVDEISRRDTRRAGILREFPRDPVVIYRAYRAR